MDGHNFSTPQVFSSTSGPAIGSSQGPQSQGNLVAADFNGDGWPDIVTANAYGITRLYDVPVPTVSPDSLVWDVAKSQTVTIKNTVSRSQAIQVAIVGGSTKSFAITSNTCGTTLAAGASCTITVEYISGQSSGNVATSTLWIRSNGAFIAQIVLSGTDG
jgi:hypothetical protein